MQILEGDLLRKMNSSRTKREIKGRKKEREQEEKMNASRKKKNASRKKKRTRAGRNMARDVFLMQASKAISVHKIIE